MTEWLDGSLADAADAVARGEVSAEELTRAAIARAESLQPTLNTFISLRAEQAIDQARGVDAARAKGATLTPLTGVPLAHKDMYYRAGEVSTCGADFLKQTAQDDTAAALQRLDMAGAIDLGGLNQTEFAVGPLGHNVHHGHIHNPWNPDHCPGGSSSGSGAATAAGIVFGALGSDTGGSVRLPAAFCGVVGMKPTLGRVSRHAMMPLSHSFDCAGPLTRTVRDNARMLAAIAGHDPRDAAASSRPVDDYEAACGRTVKGVRIGIPDKFFLADLDPELEKALGQAQDVLREAGAMLVPVTIPDPAPDNLVWNVIMAAEAATLHKRWLTAQPERYAEQVRRRLSVGLYLPATRYLEATALRDKALNRFARLVFGQCDMLFGATVPFAAPGLAETDIGADAAMPELILRVSSLTRPANFLGLPAISVPCGFNQAGLPLAMQLIGQPFDEAGLYAVAHAYEQATAWHRRRPSLS
ncbi:MAG: amidase [Alphaproteobacteria bacterium]